MYSSTFIKLRVITMLSIKNEFPREIIKKNIYIKLRKVYEQHVREELDSIKFNVDPKPAVT